MEKLTLNMIAKFSHGEMVQGTEETEVMGISTDSRHVAAGDLFVALKGGRFDGHDYLADVVRQGASGAMVGQSEMKKRSNARGIIPMVFVDDTLTGFQQLARNYRATMGVRTVAVAGSNGKTGTKELTAAVLGTKFSVLRNQGNLNNHVGVPLSLLRLDSSNQLGVFEVGTNHPGELFPLLEMVQPQVGIITTIGEEHLEFFHDLEGVAREEGTVAEALPRDGLLVLNADDPYSPSIAQRCSARVVKFGFSEWAEYRAVALEGSLDGTPFTLRTPRGETRVRLSLMGRHQVANALAAAAVGEFFGLTLDEIRRGLESVQPSEMRMQRRITSAGVLILNDAYNANPSSMHAAFEAVKEMPVTGRRIAVLGAMRELGKASSSAHWSVGRQVVASKFDMLVVVGNEAAGIAEGARSSAQPGVQIELFPRVAEAAHFLRNQSHSGDVILLKASRGVALEQILEGWE